MRLANWLEKIVKLGAEYQQALTVLSGVVTPSKRRCPAGREEALAVLGHEQAALIVTAKKLGLVP